MREYTDKYAQLALRMTDKISKRTDRFKIAHRLWELADYLESVDDGKKHEQHLVMLASKWVIANE